MSEQKSLIRTFIVENFLFGDDDGLNDSTSFLEEGVMIQRGFFDL